MSRSTDLGQPMPDPTNDMRAEPDPHCIACGHHHGSVGAHIRCLEVHLIRAQNELAPVRKLRAEVAALPTSHVKERGR